MGEPLKIRRVFDPATVQESLIPAATCSFDVGSDGARWRRVFVNEFASFLSTGGTERRIRESAGVLQIVDSANALLRDLTTIDAPSAIGTANSAGTSTRVPALDHVHSHGSLGAISNAHSFSDLAGTLSAAQHGSLGTPSDHATLVTLAPAASTRNVIQPTGDFTALAVRANAAQTLSMFEAQDSTGLALVAIDSTGSLAVSPGSLTVGGSASVTGTLTVSGTSSLQGTSVTALTANAVDPLPIQDINSVNQLLIQTASPQVQAQNNFQVLGRSSFGALVPATTITGRFSPVTGATGAYTLAQLAANSYAVTAASITFVFLDASGAVSYTGATGTVNGLSFAPSVQFTNAGALTHSALVSVIAAGQIVKSGAGALTVTERTFLKVDTIGNTILGGTIAITTLRGVWISRLGGGGGTLTNATTIGLDIDALPTSTTAIGIRQTGTAETNRLAGNTRFGQLTVAPVDPVEAVRAATNRVFSGWVGTEANPRVALLHDSLQLGPGGTTALDTSVTRSAANQLDFNSLLRPEADNTRDLGETATPRRWRNLRLSGQITIGGGTAILNHLSATASLDFALIAASATAELTITVTGAAVGDTAIVTPNGAPEAGLAWSGYVSAADTVTVRLANVTTAGIDPALRTWRADIWAH